MQVEAESDDLQEVCKSEFAYRRKGERGIRFHATSEVKRLRVYACENVCECALYAKQCTFVKRAYRQSALRQFELRGGKLLARAYTITQTKQKPPSCSLLVDNFPISNVALNTTLKIKALLASKHVQGKALLRAACSLPSSCLVSQRQ